VAPICFRTLADTFWLRQQTTADLSTFAPPTRPSYPPFLLADFFDVVELRVSTGRLPTSFPITTTAPTAQTCRCCIGLPFRGHPDPEARSVPATVRAPMVPQSCDREQTRSWRARGRNRTKRGRDIRDTAEHASDEVDGLTRLSRQPAQPVPPARSIQASSRFSD
jgi:hypothetical protein